MGIKTRNLSLESAGISPLLSPANHKVKLHSLTIQKDEKYGDKLYLNVEGPPVGSGWTGWKVPGTEEVCLGQSGRVAYSKFNFRDDAEYQRSRDEELLKAVGIICRDLGLSMWFHDAEDMNFNTVDDLIDGFNKTKPFKNIWFYTCIAGRPYKSKDGKHTNYELYFPRPAGPVRKPFHLEEKNVIAFNREEHVEALKEQTLPESNKSTKSLPPSAIETVKEEKGLQANLGFLNKGPEPGSFTAQVDRDADMQKSGLQVEGNPFPENEEEFPWNQ